MSFAKVLRASFSRVFRNPIKCLALLVVIVVSACFGLITVISFSQMPNRVQDFPVALVNNDAGTTVNGEKINYGQEILEHTEDNDSVKWVICSGDTFDKGIQDTRYYAAFIIPEDFSEKVMSAQSGTPVQADIIYLSNMRRNFLFSQMTNNIKNEFQHTITQFISDAYVTSTFDTLDTLGGSLETAADGSSRLQAASEQLGAGVSRLYDGTSALADGTGKLNDASVSLAKGTASLSQAVNRINISQIQLSDAQKESIKQTASGSQQVKIASQQLSSGIGSAISTSVKGSLTSNATENTISAKILADSNVQAMVTALKSQGYTEKEAEATIRSIVSATLDGASSQITAESLSAAVSKTVSDAMGTVAGVSALSGAEAALTQVNTSLSASAASFRQLQAATADLNAGASSLSSGIGQLDTKAVDLKTGTGTLSAGVSALQSGTAQLSSNLRSGAETLK
ncbi:MAG: YhgE/Pip family protein, partial [Bacillota bacterium]|nr:YhgE/Pip family protein [Bacillota bacterium]